MSLFNCHYICFHLNVYPTGPLLHENLDVKDLPLTQIRDLSVHLCGKDVSCNRQWKYCMKYIRKRMQFESM